MKSRDSNAVPALEASQSQVLNDGASIVAVTLFPHSRLCVSTRWDLVTEVDYNVPYGDYCTPSATCARYWAGRTMYSRSRRPRPFPKPTDAKAIVVSPFNPQQCPHRVPEGCEGLAQRRAPTGSPIRLPSLWRFAMKIQVLASIEK